MAKPTKIGLITDEVFDFIIEGQTYRWIADYFKVKLSTLADYLSKPERSARVQICLIISGDTCADNAQRAYEAISDNAQNGEIARQRELGQYWKWKAAKRAPKKYGDRIEIDSDQPVQPTPIINVTLTADAVAKAKNISKSKSK